ncbi:MAG: PEPxxWA-CTERM sorting domain-containing protein [Thiobacillus sp.]|nr:PEPxxWA-CTERM sorting domain-containing protein [Thiobacillus sp.]
MSTSTKLSVSTSITRALALGVLGVLATGAYASSPILSVTNVVTDSSNVGGIAEITYGPSIYTGSHSYNYNHTSTTVSDFSTEVDTAPTTTTPGLAYNYQTNTTTYTWDRHTWNHDSLSIDVTSNGANQAGGKWISLTGSVQSSIDTTLSFDLSASGNFTSIETPLGSAAPLLASFYLGDSQPTLSSLSSVTSASLESLSYYSYTSSYSTASFNLLAGVSQNFVAYVYAPTDVSVSSFNLDAYTSNYNYVVTPQTQIYVGPKTLIGASALAPIPEPETYAMMLAGLGLVGAMIRRRTNATV